MLTIGLLPTFITGFSAIALCGGKTGIIERLGLSFPAGVGIVTFAMLLADWVGIPLTGASDMSIAVIMAVGLTAAAVVLRKRDMISFDKETTFPVKKWNLLWIVLIGYVVWMEYANFTKCMFLPVTDRDSLAGFDTTGFLVAAEHTLKGLSIYQDSYVPTVHNAGSYISYTPMVPLSYAFVYSLGAETSKVIPALMYLSFLVAFYGVIARTCTHTSAALATFFVMLAPEMTMFSSLSGTNVMHAIFASLSLIYIYRWYAKGEAGAFALGVLLLAINAWCRAEGVAFIATAAVVAIIHAVKNKNYTCIAWGLLSLLPAVVWAIYTSANGMTTEGTLITHPFWDGEKASKVFNYAMALLSNTQYYGWAWPALWLALLANSPYLLRHKDAWTFPCMWGLAVLVYFVIVYQINYTWDSIDNVLSYSSKRFLFCFVPLAWYYFVSNRMIDKAMKKLTDFLAK